MQETAPEEDESDFESDDVSDSDSEVRCGERFKSRSDWIPLDQALKVEVEAQRKRREHLQTLGLEQPKQEIGVCLSGGGIRSACLSLGMLQRLHEKDMLHEVSHLSCVSGGSYAGGAFATDLLAEYEKREPRGPAEVRETYGEALAATVQRFQDNANWPLLPMSCIRKMKMPWLRRACGITFFLMLMIWLLIGHPLTLVLYFIIPSAIFVNYVQSPSLRLALCVPTIVCEDRECSSATPLSWTQRVIGLQDEAQGMTWVAFIIAAGLGLIRLSGVLLYLRKQGWKKSALVLDGLEMCLKRLLLCVGLGLLLLNWAVQIQTQTVGTVEENWDVFADVAALHSAQGLPVGWILDFNLSNRVYDTFDSTASVKLFHSWYSCFNYTVSVYQASGGNLSIVSDQAFGRHWRPISHTVPSFREARPDEFDIQSCGQRGFSDPARSMWSISTTESFLAFYWGRFLNRPGQVMNGTGPMDPHRRSYYQEWHNECAARDQVMCYAQKRGAGRPTIQVYGQDADWSADGQEGWNGWSLDRHSGEATLTAGCCETSLGMDWLFGILLFWLGVGAIAYVLMAVTSIVKYSVMFAGPLILMYIGASLLNWMTFGPITAAPAPTGTGQDMGMGWIHYTSAKQFFFVSASFMVCLCALPCFELLQRVGSKYGECALVNAFFRPAKAAANLVECKEVPLCPNLLFGAALLMHRNSFEDASNTHMFVMATHYAGFGQSQYVKTPDDFAISRAMALSAAALETALLVAMDSWSVRFYVFLLSATLGDWVRFDPSSCLQWSKNRNSSLQRVADGLPSFVLFAMVYVLFILSGVFFEADDCKTAKVCAFVAVAIMLVLALATFFAPMCRSLMNLLQPSPMLRLMQLFCVSTPVTEKVPPYVYLGDGGLLENSGCLQLLRRQVPLILVMEAGDDEELNMGTLKILMDYCEAEKLCSFFVPGQCMISPKEAIEKYQSNESSTFLHLGILYGRGQEEGQRKVGHLLWVQNRPRGPSGWTKRPQVAAFPDPDKRWESASLLGDHRGGAGAARRRHGGDEADDLVEEDEAAAPPLSALQSACWNGCCLPCGEFPTVATALPFFSPMMAANFMNFGYYLVEDAVDLLMVLKSKSTLSFE
eukprot:TRINITY_DN30158_c2_g1_i1.p1 TRINITY_DN30158_c2_g1~~TRINITY_DN30158_c2_g1_i1.p1  ORF type:complete len:1113 (-),score=254.66 TRINITY_DN30158_c2_g1_i1:21-3359(-)